MKYRNVKDAIRPLQDLYEDARVWDFGPAALRVVREQMIAANLSRKVVNARVKPHSPDLQVGCRARTRRSCRAAGSSIRRPPSKRGRSKARESDRVMPVSQGHIDAVLCARDEARARHDPIAARHRDASGRGCPDASVRHRHVPARSGSTAPRHTRPSTTARSGSSFSGPQAQEIVRPFLKTRSRRPPFQSEGCCLGCPRESEAEEWSVTTDYARQRLSKVPSEAVHSKQLSKRDL